MGQTTPFIGIYIPAAGETNYGESFAAGMMNIDQHDHSGGPNKGVPITNSGLANFSVTYNKLNANVVDITTGIGTRGAPFQNQLQILGYLRSLYQLSLSPGLGFVVMNGATPNARTFQDTSSIVWNNGDGTGNPSADVDQVDVDQGGTGVNTLTPYAPLLGGTTATGPIQQPGVGNAGEVYTSQGPGAPGVFTALGGLGQIQYVNFTLTAAQVRGLNASSIQVLPAQGSGKVIVPIFCYGLLNSDGTAFTLASGTTSIGFFYNDSDRTTNFANSAFINTTTDTYWWTTQSPNSTGATKTNGQNKPFYIGMDGPLIAYANGGNSTITFTLAYTVITL